MREETDEEKEVPGQKEMSQEVNDIKEKMMEGQTTKTLTKEEIQAALEERHSPEIQKKLSAGHVTIAGLGGWSKWRSTCKNWCRAFALD